MVEDDVAPRLCATLARDEDDLVRKGVGWALKDGARAGLSVWRRVIELVKTDAAGGGVVDGDAVRDPGSAWAGAGVGVGAEIE